MFHEFKKQMHTTTHWTLSLSTEAAKYDAFGPNHGGAFRPFDCGRTA